MDFSYHTLRSGKLALVVNSPHGSAVYSSKIIERDRSRLEITEAEIENIIAQSIWKLFDEERVPFASRLDISEMDIILADVRVLHIKLDDNFVVNPIGFTAKKVEIGLSGTLISRATSEKIRSSAPKDGEVVLTIVPAASAAWLLQKELKHKNFVLADVSDDTTVLYRVDESGIVSSLSDFNWGVKNIIMAISKSLLVSESVAKDILKHFVSHDMSEPVLKSVKNIVSDAMSEFVKGVTAAVYNVKIKKTVVVVRSDELSDLESARLGIKESELKFNFLSKLPIEEIVMREFSVADLENVFNKIAKRRMRWLTFNKIH